jgi:transmembrane sensor
MIFSAGGVMRAEDIEEKASIWLAREQAGLSAQEQRALEDWLAESSRHMVAYLRLRAAWERAGRLAALKAPMRPVTASSSPWLKLRIPAIAAALLVLVWGGYSYLESGGKTQTVRYSTAVGQTRAFQLADGTRMDLNTNSRVRVDISGRERAVTLESGEAFFDVTHDPHKPFFVNAGKRRISDIGTKFSVFLDGDSVRVLVLEGQVRVETQSGMEGPAPVVAGAGQLVIAQGMGSMVLAKPDSEVASGLSWRGGMLTFDKTPLTEAAKEFNRYNARKILVDDNARNIRIGGSFKADNLDDFVMLLQQGFGLSAKKQGGNILVSRKQRGT